jgi:ArsR family transcriptional regulator
MTITHAAARRPERGLCPVPCIHTERVRAVQDRMPAGTAIRQLADFFKLFGDPTRLAILWALGQGELCVCDLGALLGMRQPAVSHQLKTLRQARIVRSRREGKVVFYTLEDEHIRRLLSMGFEHQGERPAMGRGEAP